MLAASVVHKLRASSLWAWQGRQGKLLTSNLPILVQAFLALHCAAMATMACPFSMGRIGTKLLAGRCCSGL